MLLALTFFFVSATFLTFARHTDASGPLRAADCVSIGHAGLVLVTQPASQMTSSGG